MPVSSAPTSVEAFLQRTFSATGIETQLALASILGVNRAAISMAKKKGKVPEKWALKLSQQYGLNPRWLLEGRGERYQQGEHAATTMAIPRVVARLCAGGGSFETGSMVRDTMVFSRSWLTSKGNPKTMVLMDVMGDSMEPELKDGDTVLLDHSQTSIHAGSIYALGLGDTLLIKRIRRQPRKMELISTNPDYAPIVLQGDELETLRILGRILWVCREYQ